ncbi:dephospho-CoA kinase [Noviherbaspirillum sedimenti]|uniref:Dephospho-CoA kinase n=1 Tax=Noviherbaspirillum sedimenti TaxID=2320865 RepID=A0A3A3GRX0_9BURK|nr:dephospho-CoA kinase [Noviherbaspirillum sedimenti]RJG03710.1 dephospho-CoA kinase [Noviherbaspirillum sedimenti]
MAAAAFSVGLTGGIGSGKTTVANMFAARGAALIDTDQIAHALTQPGGIAMPAIATQFGADFIASTGAMDRARMRAAVFADPAAKKRLEAILHPLIKSECERLAQQAQGPYRIFVVPLLVESGNWKERVSRVLVVDCPEQQQLLRVMDRNGLSEAEVRAIMATQATRAQRLAAADDILLNDGDPAALDPQVERLHALYCSLAHAGT